MEILALQEDFALRYLETVSNATVEERTAAIDRFGNVAQPDIFAISDDGTEASINITGVLSQDGPSPIARFFGFGGTGYKDIIAAAQLIGEDARIKTVRLKMNTPGGNVEGMDQARQAISELSKIKNVIAENHGMIASAGYYLAVAANRIEALSPFAQTGSIGIVIGGLDASKAMESAGIRRVKIISKNAPDKQPDPTTKQGESILQAEVDATERVFLQKVAEGRNTTVENVIANFGKGGMLIAQDPDASMPDAVKVGMIDAVVSGNVIFVAKEYGANAIGGGNPETAAQAVHKKESIKMDLKQLKQEHPAVFAEAVSAGVQQERDRVNAHVTMGQASGDMKLAIECISEGSEVTSTVQAKHFAAGMNRNDIAKRVEEKPADVGAAAKQEGDTLGEEVVKRIEAAMGVTNG